MRGVLRVAAGPPESASWAVFPAAVHRLLRGSVVGAGDCVAGRGFSEPAGFPGPGRDRGAAEPLDAVAHAASDRRGNARGGFHVGAGTVGGSGSGAGEDGRVDATTLEANAAMRSIERRDTGESYEAFVRQLAKASGIETPTRAELARFDRSRKDRKTSNKEWQSPQDTDAKIIQAAGCNLGLLLRRLTGVGTPRSLQGRALSAICGLIGRLTALWGRLTASWDFQWTPAGLVGSITHRQAA